MSVKFKRRPQFFSKSPPKIWLYVVNVKCKKVISQNFVLAFSQNLNFIKRRFIDPLGFSFGLEIKLQNQNFVSLKSFFAKLDMKWAASTYWDCSSIFWRSNYILPQWIEFLYEVCSFFSAFSQNINEMFKLLNCLDSQK